MCLWVYTNATPTATSGVDNSAGREAQPPGERLTESTTLCLESAPPQHTSGAPKGRGGTLTEDSIEDRISLYIMELI